MVLGINKNKNNRNIAQHHCIYCITTRARRRHHRDQHTRFIIRKTCWLLNFSPRREFRNYIVYVSCVCNTLDRLKIVRTCRILFNTRREWDQHFGKHFLVRLSSVVNNTTLKNNIIQSHHTFSKQRVFTKKKKKTILYKYLYIYIYFLFIRFRIYVIYFNHYANLLLYFIDLF